MDFDEEMSSLQIEDLGEYFFPNELSNDNWKGFSLGYGEDDVPSTTVLTSTSNTKPIAITSRSVDQRDRSGSLSTSLGLGGGGISLGNMLHDPSLLVSPPLTAPSFSEMLKHTNGALTAAALGLTSGDFPMPPGTTHMSTVSHSLTALSTAMTMTQPATVPKSSAPLRSKDEQLMDLTNFTLEGRFNPPPRPLSAKPALATDGSNAAAVCKRIMDDDEDDDDDDDEEYSTKRRSTAFGSKRPFDMVDPCPSSSCATIVAPEDDRGFRKKSREKMRRQEVNVKFDELIELLGLSNRVRKSAILQEAVSAIKTLKRERDEMRRDRDRLQGEVSKLATCLQYSHLGSVAAANAVAMSQAAAQNNPHFQPPLNAHALPGPGCFPIGGATFGATLAPAGSVTPTVTPSALNATPIAPKVLKAASDVKSS